MLHLLRRHAVPIRAHLRTSLVLAYALPAEILRPLIGPGLELDTFGNFGFLAVAMVETTELRPAFLPRTAGLNFFLAGYRIFTRYRTTSGRSFRGLKILRSDTNRSSMCFFGNLLTHYGYEFAQVNTTRIISHYAIRIQSQSGRADLQVEADLTPGNESLPPGSPFATMQEARKFAGPLPFTFDYERQTHSMIRVEGVRSEWHPRPVPVTVHQNTFLQQPPFSHTDAVLANAFYLENVPYRWKPGVREPLP
ncbi:MAG TPA: DUF2071 domain-containing protein [Terracidiphilus sp.]|nr:DUF2071 domain-containing protein [Terracidiphilus sp.]